MQNKTARRTLVLGFACLTLAVIPFLQDGLAVAQSTLSRERARFSRFAPKLPSPPRPRPLEFSLSTVSQYDIRNYGAVGDNKTDDTAAVQAALNAAAAGGGGIVYVPAGIYKVGNLIFPPNGDHWITIWMDGNLRLTQTLQMNQRAYALVGRSGAVFTGFQQKPSTQIFFDPSLNPVIHITADPVYLSGFVLRYLHGDGILATDGSTNLTLDGIYAVEAADVDTQWAPLKFETSHYNFGLYVKDSVFQAAQQAGAHSIILKNQSIVSVKDTTLICGGISASAPNSPEASGYDFEHVLYEGGFSSFLTIDNSNAWFTGISLRFVEMADPSLPGLFFVENSGTGTTDNVQFLFPHGDAKSLVGGSRPITGVSVLQSSTTAQGDLSFLGQQDDYTYMDNHGVMNIGRLRLGFGGSQITKHLSSAPTLDFSPIPAGGQQEQSISLVGARVGDSCDASPVAGAETGLTWACYVPGQDTVVVRVVNSTPAPITPAARAWRIDLWQH